MPCQVVLQFDTGNILYYRADSVHVSWYWDYAYLYAFNYSYYLLVLPNIQFESLLQKRRWLEKKGDGGRENKRKENGCIEREMAVEKRRWY